MGGVAGEDRVAHRSAAGRVAVGRGDVQRAAVFGNVSGHGAPGDGQIAVVGETAAAAAFPCVFGIDLGGVPGDESVGDRDGRAVLDVERAAHAAGVVARRGVENGGVAGQDRPGNVDRGIPRDEVKRPAHPGGVVGVSAAGDRKSPGGVEDRAAPERGVADICPGDQFQRGRLIVVTVVHDRAAVAGDVADGEDVLHPDGCAGVDFQRAAVPGGVSAHGSAGNDHGRTGIAGDLHRAAVGGGVVEEKGVGDRRGREHAEDRAAAAGGGVAREVRAGDIQRSGEIGFDRAALSGIVVAGDRGVVDESSSLHGELGGVRGADRRPVPFGDAGAVRADAPERAVGIQVDPLDGSAAQHGHGSALGDDGLRRHAAGTDFDPIAVVELVFGDIGTARIIRTACDAPGAIDDDFFLFRHDSDPFSRTAAGFVFPERRTGRAARRSTNSPRDRSAEAALSFLRDGRNPGASAPKQINSGQAGI